MFWRNRPTLVRGMVCVLGSMALAAGCGGGNPDAGTNGVAKLPPNKIEAKTRAAVESARAVRLSGTVLSKGNRFRIDMRLKGGGGVGEVATRGKTFEVLRVGKVLFLKADKAFYRGDGAAEPTGRSGAAGEDAAADKLKGKYVKVPPGDPAYEQLSGFTDIRVIIDGLFVLHGDLAIDGRGQVRGKRTVVLAADGGKGGEVEVSLEGSPYPLRYRRAGGTGTLELSDYNKDFLLKAPNDSSVVDYGEQIGPSDG